MKTIVISVASVFLLAGCIPFIPEPNGMSPDEFAVFLKKSSTDQFGVPAIDSINHPGRVAVAVEETLGRLRNKGSDLERQCSALIPRSLPVVSTVDAPAGYGLDDRFNAVSNAFKSLGTACFIGDLSACQQTQSYAMRWATEAELNRPRGGRHDSVFWNDTLTVNMRLVLPMLSALGIAEERIPMPKSDRARFDPWVESIVKINEHMMRQEGRYDPPVSARKAAHNHAMQSSNAYMALGAWLGDVDYFENGLEQWKITLNSMRGDGSLPIETRRGARALFYQGRAITALTLTAEIASSQGIDLWAWAPSEDKTIHMPVKFLIDALENPNLVFPYARINHAPGPSKDWRRQDVASGSTFGWVASYMSRFPEHPNTVRMQNRVLGVSAVPENRLTVHLDSAVKRGGTVGGDWNVVNGRCLFGEGAL